MLGYFLEKLWLPNLSRPLTLLLYLQDANRIIRQSDKYSQYADIIVPIFRALQSYRLRNLAEAYVAFEKASKYVAF